MNEEREISFNVKTCNKEKVNIFVDDKPVKIEDGKLVWHGENGKHRIKIEQVKKHKSKTFWLYVPAMFIAGFMTGDIEFDGKTPLYSKYEADIIIDNDVEIDVNLKDDSVVRGRYKKDVAYKLQVEYPRRVGRTILKDEFTATKEEKMKWFLAHSIFMSLILGLIVFVGITMGFRILKEGSGIGSAIFAWLLAAVTIGGWILAINRYYKASLAIEDKWVLRR